MTTKENIRAISLELLMEILEQGSFSHLVMREALDKYAYLSKQERAFLTRLTIGTVERKIELDYLIDQVSKTKTKKMKPVIRNILRMGVYQLKYMDAVPDSAACNEAVKLAVKKGFSGLRGFVNGVMRTLVRSMDTIAYPDREQSPKEWLSVADSMPEWLVAQWIESYGLTQTTQICESFFAPSQTTIRVNEVLTSKEELVQRLRTQQICVEEVPQMPEALYISGYDSLESIPEFAEGFFYVQDLSSMQIADVLAPKEGEFILDVCAAPGGKATHAALRMKNTGTVLARDISEEKTALIRDNIRKLRLSNSKAECFDACVLDDAMIERADAVIADLPCSGFGVIAKKPDIKYHTSLEDVKALAALQRQMLHVVCRYVRPGGRLVYSTCTISREENEENTAWFLKEHPEFCLEAEHQIFPEDGKWDGFYYALLKKS